jgi:hypothetical protein
MLNMAQLFLAAALLLLYCCFTAALLHSAADAEAGATVPS